MSFHGVKELIVLFAVGVLPMFARAFLDAVNVASVALIAVVTWHLGRTVLIDLPTGQLDEATAIFLWRFHVNSAWLALGGGLVILLLG